MTSSAAVDFHTQIASIMEVLANAAVAEICKVVDDGYAEVSLEVNQSSKENAFLRRKIKLLELQMARYRAERCKSTGPGFLSVRVMNNRAHNEALAGPSLQGRTRFLNRGPGVNQPKTKPINLDQDPDQDVVTTTKTESADAEMDGENQLLIVKVEGAVESGEPVQETFPGAHVGTRAGVEDHDAVASPAGGQGDCERDGNAAAAGHPGETEVSGSDVISFVVVRSEAEGGDELTGGDVRSAKAEPPCEDRGVGGEEEEVVGGHWAMAGDTLPRVCAGATARVDNASSSVAPPRAAVTVTASRPGEPVPQNAGCVTSSLAPGSSSALEVIVIDGEAAPGEDDAGALRWQSTSDCRSPIRGAERSGGDAAPLASPKKQPVWTEPAGKGGSWFYPHGGNAPGAFPGLTASSHATVAGDVQQQHAGRQNANAAAAGQFKHSDTRAVRVQQQPGSDSSYVSYPPVNHIPSQSAGPAHQAYQKLSGHPGQRPAAAPYASGGSDQQTHINPASMYRPYSCTSCSKCFFVAADLQRHMARHTREKPFSCQVCGKSFVCKSQLQMHVNVHTGARPFSCAVCGRRFSHPSNLKRHQKIQH